MVASAHLTMLSERVLVFLRDLSDTKGDELNTTKRRYSTNETNYALITTNWIRRSLKGTPMISPGACAVPIGA